jgi:sec-independent protein translocase protein TatA
MFVWKDIKLRFIKRQNMFGNLGGGELFLILIIVLVLFGPKKIPEIAQGIGKGMREFKKALKDVEDDISLTDKNETPKNGTSQKS